MKTLNTSNEFFFQLYENLKDEFFNNHGAMEVPTWANEVAAKSVLPSKL